VCEIGLLNVEMLRGDEEGVRVRGGGGERVRGGGEGGR